MQTDLLQEARRQAEICNACRYCEGYCSVFPALHAERFFSDGDLTQLANLCHNCRGCYYACQYTAPHEFGLNLPKVLAEVRHDSWETHAWPTSVARAFQKSGVMIALATVLGFAVMFLAIHMFKPAGGDGFYAVLSHSVMIAIFLPAFLFPLVSIAISLTRYWHTTGGTKVTLAQISVAFESAAKMKNLAGGHGDGCNFEDEDRFSQARRLAHQAVMYGFLLCFASTSVGTLMHYFLDMPAPYPFWSLPKLLGISGGILMVIGTVKLAMLKLQADKNLGAPSVWGGEMGFIVLLFVVSLSGLLLYVLGGTVLLPALLAIHLGSVLGFFLLTPYTKMAHGFYRLAALVRDEQRRPAG
ncbi:MAG: tricarballylate utilization 4Fe-4S protein TcuB [Roseibium sp.]|uniref:tricarballylate utilization 4Fe-4S protein TcuB n=1 Tax=Roseibium sp. TaxID=1936156 RepID=UPI00261D5F32|nr:tricarballylate utilization 4Fe-4S protein TcuB [Roseibium sp.]MCV0423880.1 tricarballylate utilization 4Fe-4S protein TcuB [Roseibium sp.]